MLKSLRRTLIYSLIAIGVLLSTVSCRYQPEVTAVYETPETWSDLFYVFWNKMNTGYLFWEIDDPTGTEWDATYDTYKPLFDKLGKIGADTTETDIAFRYFFEITEDLSGGHFTMDLNDGAGKYIVLEPGENRVLSRLGYSEGQIYNYIKSYDGSSHTLLSDPEYVDLYNYYDERTYYVFTEVLDKRVDPSVYIYSNVLSDSPLTDTQYFSTLYYTFSNTGDSDLNVLLGRTSDDIVYFSFNGFRFTRYCNPNRVGDMAYEFAEILEKFQNMIAEESTQGVIIDLRGNGGGYVADLDLIWGAFGNGEAIYYEQDRTKNGDNRHDYSDWMDTYLAADSTGKFDKNVPIVILTNYRSLSCSEATCLIFMALRDYYGYDVTFIGEQTGGGFGMISSEAEAEESYKAGRTSIQPYVTSLYTASGAARYRDGTCYEGVGIAPDIEVKFNYDNFSKGKDDKLDAALSYLRTK